jgi:cephalosporin hydroxylase
MLAPTITDLCPVLTEMIRTRRAVGKTGCVFDGLVTLSTTGNLHAIHSLMRELRPLRTLEVGLSFGGSALAFCASHKELGRAPEAQHLALDPFQSRPHISDSCGLLAVERAGLKAYLDLREAYSEHELPKLLEGNHQFGLIYIDGSHLFEHVFVDAFFATRLLAEGGVVLFDDSSNPHVAKVIRFLRSNGGDGLQELDLAPYRRENDRLRYAVAHYFGKVQLTAFRRIGPVERHWASDFRSF